MTAFSSVERFGMVRSLVRAQPPAPMVIRMALLVLLVSTACTGGPPPPPQPGPELPLGGTARFALDRWPQCLNPITACAETSENSTVVQLVLPKLMWIDEKGNPEASPLIELAPSLDNGGLTRDPFSVTYHLNPKAVWDDGSPIRAFDVQFTLKAILNTKGTTRPIGYDKITSITVPDPKTFTLNFSEPYADWYDLFGGVNTNGYVLEKAAFPGADPDKPDLSKEMNTRISFSGGPWKMISWSREELVLARNDRYWGHQPILDQAVFMRMEERPVLEYALATGQVDAANLHGGLPEGPGMIPVNPNVKSISGTTNDEDAFWFNLDYPPMNDPEVRQAIAYGVDRQAIIDQIIKKNDPTATVLNCLPPLSPVIDDWCTPTVTASMEKYTYQPDSSISLLEGDGYDCSGVPAKPCTKNGQPLRIAVYYTRGDVRRQAVGYIVQEGMKKAGIDWLPTPQEGTDLFSNRLPKGDYQVVEYESGATVDPSPVAFGYTCDYVQGLPEDTRATYSLRYCNPELDPIMEQADREVDPSRRHELITQVFSQINTDLVALPLFSDVVITAWRADRIAGPIGQWNEAPYGAFWNIDNWYAL